MPLSHRLRRATELLRVMLRHFGAGAPSSGPTPMRAAVTGAVFLAGLFGFAQVYHPTTAVAWIDLLFRTAQLVTGQFPQELLPAPGAPRIPVPVALDVARFALPALVFWLALSGLVRRIRRPLRAAGARTLRGHLVLAGAGEAIAALAAEATAARRRAVVLSAPGAAPPEGEIGSAATLTGELGATGTWRRAGLARAATVAIVGVDDAAVLAAALAAAEVACEERAAGAPPLQLVCAADDADVLALLDGVFRGRDPTEGVVLSATSPARLRARALLARHPLHRGIDVAAGEPVRVMVVGFGRAGEEIALQVLKTGIVPDAPPPEVVVVDPAGERLVRNLRARYRGAAPLAGITVIPEALDPGDGEAVYRLCEQVGTVGATYLCLADETEALLGAIALRRWAAAAGAGAPPVYLRTRRGGDLGRRLAAAALDDLDLTRIHAFGHEEARTLETLTGSELDARARRIHDHYLAAVGASGGRAAQRGWPLLGEVYRQANRDQADYLPMRLASLGLMETMAPVRLPAAVVERGARAEHARWMASAAFAGWRLGSRDDGALRHPDLVGYEALDEAGREKDRSVLRGLGVQLAPGRGVAPARVVPLADLPPVGDAVMVESSLATAEEARALRAAAVVRPGLRWRLRLDPRFTPELRGWSAAARADALWLVDGAEQVLWRR